jgi:hypothetical protein
MCDPEGSLDAACTTKPQALTIVDATVNTAQPAFTPVINPYLLKASLTFSPASFRFDFTCSPLPSFRVRLSPVTLPTASLALPRSCWPLFFALSVPLTVSAPNSRRSTRVAERPGPGYLASESSKPHAVLACGALALMTRSASRNPAEATSSSCAALGEFGEQLNHACANSRREDVQRLDYVAAAAADSAVSILG